MPHYELHFSESLNEFHLYGIYGGENFIVPHFTPICKDISDSTAHRFIESVRNEYDRPVTLDEVKKCFEKFKK